MKIEATFLKKKYIYEALAVKKRYLYSYIVF